MPVGYNMIFPLGVIFFVVWLYVTYKLFNYAKRVGKMKKVVWFGPIIFIIAALAMILGN